MLLFGFNKDLENSYGQLETAVFQHCPKKDKMAISLDRSENVGA